MAEAGMTDPGDRSGGQSAGRVSELRRRANNLRWKIRHWWTWDRPYSRILPAVVERSGYVVQSGPFAGLKYIKDVPLDQALVPRLLGAYEGELQYPVSQMLDVGYDTLIDVGSSEGYYANGFARSSTKTRVYAFDIEESMQAWCKRMAELNEVGDRVEVRGLCDAQAIQDLASGRTLVFSDCEGGEVDLLDPDVAPVLRHTDVLVELHDLFVPGASQTIRQRFEDTHDIYVIDSMVHDTRRFPALASLRESDRRIALDERRPASMQWFVMWARQPGS